jgi:hypothetical protein
LDFQWYIQVAVLGKQGSGNAKKACKQAYKMLKAHAVKADRMLM